jgi:transcriptional regulator with XRE-family HTH domain
MGIREIREARGLSRREVAQACGFTEATLVNIESRKSGRVVHLMALADYFDVSMDEIVGREEVKSGSV